MVRVSFRPVDGLRVWRSPLPLIPDVRAALPDVVRSFAQSVDGVPGVAVSRAPTGALDVTFDLDDQGALAAALVPRSASALCLWSGLSRAVQVCSAPDADLRTRVVADAVCGMVAATGDEAVRVPWLEPGVCLRGETVHVVQVARARLLGLGEGREGGVSDERWEAELGRTPLRAALLAARPPVTVDIDAEAVRRRAPGSTGGAGATGGAAGASVPSGFALAYGLLAARRSVAEAGAVPGTVLDGAPGKGGAGEGMDRALVTDLVASPFVLATASRQGDPSLWLRHLLGLAARADRVGGVIAESVAAVLTCGLQSLSLEVPTRL